jgi:hypothetical protein
MAQSRRKKMGLVELPVEAIMIRKNPLTPALPGAPGRLAASATRNVPPEGGTTNTEMKANIEHSIPARRETPNVEMEDRLKPGLQLSGVKARDGREREE